MLEFRQKQGRAGERYWRIAVKGDKIFTEWGSIDKQGAHSKHGATTDIPGPKGKEGTKAYYTAEENAVFNAERLIRKKKEEGYVELGAEASSANEIDFRKPLPKNLAFSKPQNSIEPEKLAKIKSVAIFTRKVNGMAAIIYSDCDGVFSIYSRRMEDCTSKFPHAIEDLQRMKIPKSTILLAEAFMGSGDTKEDFNKMQSIMNAKTKHALAMQEQLGPVNFYIYRLPVWRGVPIEQTSTNAEWIEQMENLLGDRVLRTNYFSLLETFRGGIDKAKEIALKQGYEGWVVYQGDGTMGDKSFSFHGKPDRPNCCWKVKYHSEDDFCARWDPKREVSGGHCKNGCQYDDHKQVQKCNTTGHCPKCGKKLVGDGTFGSGKHSGVVGTLSLYQYTPSGVPVYICEVGTGMTDEERAELADVTKYPLTVQVIYDDRRYRSKGDSSNALLFPRVGRIREDKEPRECVNEELVTSS